MPFRTLTLVLCLLVPRLLRADAPTGSFELRISDPAGSEAPSSMLAPLPFPRGAVSDPGRIRIVRDDGFTVPAQFDVAARYRDGSLRWAHAAFRGAPSRGYRVEYGPAVVGASPEPVLRIETLSGGVRIVDTGTALFTLQPDALMIDEVAVRQDGSYLTVVENGGGGATLVDNQGREARAAGPAADVAVEVLREGPGRAVIRTEGWYVTAEGERLARGILRMTFSAGSSEVHATHTLVFTEDTNRLWVRDYGLDVPLAGEGARTAAFPRDRDHPAGGTVEEPLRPSEAVFVLQETFPHFGERESRVLLGAGPADTPATRDGGEAAGDWMDVEGPGFGLTVVVPRLAEQFPKELEARSDRLRVGLWPERSGRELDFRAETLVRDYWGRWVELAPGGAEAAAGWPSNAQGAAKTHEVRWIFRADPGREGVPEAAKRASAGLLVMPDPAWAAASRAIGWPMRQYDPERFPREEALIEDYWNRMVLPLQIFPMTGVIAWGSQPYLGYIRLDGRRYARFYRIGYPIDYGVKRHVWGLYLRSGDRRYYEYGRRFNRFAADWSQFNWDAEPDRIRGAFIHAHIHRPVYWHGRSELLSTTNSGYDIQNWLLDYYMTGDERPLEAARLFGEAMRRHWDLDAAAGGSSPYMILKVLTSLYAMDWDPEFGEMAHSLRERIVDLDRAHPSVLSVPLYKVDRDAMALFDYYEATGDETAREAMIRIMDYQWRFNRLHAPISYQNAQAYLFTILWEWTGDTRYLRAIRRLIDGHFFVEHMPLSEQLADMDVPLADAESIFRLLRPTFRNMHPLLGMPAALSTPAPDAPDLDHFPVLMKTESAEEAVVFFHKENHEPVLLSFYYQTVRPGDVRPTIRVFRSDGTLGEEIAAEIEIERRMDYSRAPFRPGDGPYQFSHFHAHIRVPGEVPPGLYAIDTGGPEEMIVLESTAREVALFCPDGFWAPGTGHMWNLKNNIAAGSPMYFRVPEGLEELRLFLGRPFTVFRPDGSVALAEDPENVGDLALPVEGHAGTWSVVGRTQGNVKLRNVTPVVAMGTPDRLPSLPVEAQPRMPEAPAVAAGALFLEGARGAVLAGGGQLRFPRGEPLPDGGWEHFPGDEGTVEFWYLPFVSDNERTFTLRDTQESSFVSSGSLAVRHRFGGGPRTTLLYAFVDLQMRGETGPGQRPSPARDIGTPAQHFFHAGRWVHIAATWRLREGERGTEGDFTVFIDGTPRLPAWSSPARLSGREPFRMDEPGEFIVMGSADGAIRDLRISAGVRYDGPFDPYEERMQPDGPTLVFFPFDGHTRGLRGPDGAAAVEAQWEE